MTRPDPRTPRRRLLGLAAAAGLHATALVLTTPRAAPGVAAPDALQAAYEHAARAFRDRRYAAAYGQFARLADAGHAGAAAAALLMQRDARALFDNAWYATPDQQRRWAALAATHLAGVPATAPHGRDAL